MSQGQRRLLCLGEHSSKTARCYNDEATSSIDRETDALVQKTIIAHSRAVLF